MKHSIRCMALVPAIVLMAAAGTRGGPPDLSQLVSGTLKLRRTLALDSGSTYNPRIETAVNSPNRDREHCQPNTSPVRSI